MRRSKNLDDPKALEKLKEVLPPEEFRDALARLAHGGDRVFCAAAASLATELLFTKGREHELSLPTRMELLLGPVTLKKLAEAMATDQASKNETAAIRNENSFAVRLVLDRANEYLAEIIMRLNRGSDALFCKLIAIFAALFCSNVKNLDAQWDQILDDTEHEEEIEVDPKNKPN